MNVSWRQFLAPLVAVVALTVPARAVAIVGGQPPAVDDRRFDAVGAWSRASWLGLGENPQHQHNWFGAATLVRANLVVTAQHIAEAIDSAPGTYAVRFRRRIDGGLGSAEDGPFSYHHALVSRIVHGPGDLALAYLSEPVTHITPISVMQMGFLGLDGSPYVSAGWGREGPAQGEGPRHQLLLCAQNNLSRIELGRLSYPGFGTNPVPPCAVNLWDSGGAVLVEEQGRLWLLAAHQTYTSAPTLWPWLDQAPPQMLHTAFPQLDLAVEQLVVVGSNDVLRGEALELSVLMSNPGSRRLTPEQGELVIEVHNPGVQEDRPRQLYRQSISRNWQSRQRRNESVEVAIPATMPVGIYRADVQLSQMAESDIVRNNRVALDGVVSIRSRRNPFERLSMGALVRRLDEDHLQLINLIYLERRHGRQALWTFGSDSGGGESFNVVNYDGPIGATSVDTPWGVITLDWTQDEPLGAPEGFSGAIHSIDHGDYAPFSGIYEGTGPQSEKVMLMISATGHVSGFLVRGDATIGVNMQFRDLAYRAEAAESQTAFRALELSWNEELDAASLVMIDAEGGRFEMQREEEPVAPYETCRNGLQCQSYAGDRQMQCYRATDQVLGVCSASSCADEPARCGELARCLVDPDVCAPICAATEECPTGMVCTHERVCVDCTTHPTLCAQPDAGPSADAGINSDVMITDTVPRAVDAGSVAVDASVIDSGGKQPSPGGGCSCSGLEWSGLWWAVPILVFGRRRRYAH